MMHTVARTCSKSRGYFIRKYTMAILLLLCLDGVAISRWRLMIFNRNENSRNLLPYGLLPQIDCCYIQQCSKRSLWSIISHITPPSLSLSLSLSLARARARVFVGLKFFRIASREKNAHFTLFEFTRKFKCAYVTKQTRRL